VPFWPTFASHLSLRPCLRVTPFSRCKKTTTEEHDQQVTTDGSSSTTNDFHPHQEKQSLLSVNDTVVNEEAEAVLEQSPIVAAPKKKRRRNNRKSQKKVEEYSPEELSYYQNPFAIDTRTEIGLLSSQFLGPVGKYMFYFIIWIYLFGDLAIYAVAVPSTLLKVTGALFGMSHMGTYRMFVALFGMVVVPFSFFNFQKTKYLQIFTLFTRNLAFCIMILLSIIFVFKGEGASFKNLLYFRVQGLGVLYGTGIYAFMCHHSLPSIVLPIKNKKKLSLLFGGDFLLIFSAYIVLCFSALLAFGNQTLAKFPDKVRPGPACQIQKLFTLNFTSYDHVIIGGFLSLFPVFTLTTNYPLISITMRNNLQTLFEPVALIRNFKYNPYLFSALSSIPPIIVALITDNLSFLVSLTGAIAGVFIQFIFPAILVLQSRRKMRALGAPPNPHTSPFSHAFWAVSIMIIGIIGFFVSSGLQIYDIVQSFIKK